MSLDDAPDSVRWEALKRGIDKPRSMASIRAEIEDAIRRVQAGEKSPPHPDSFTPEGKALRAELLAKLERIAQMQDRGG